MTRTEQAAMNRLERRNDALRMTLRIIHTWLSAPTANWVTSEMLCLWIRTLVADTIAAEKAAEKKEREITP